ncbi:MAG: hypothetical protein WBC91_07615 [Phototrophicaceae bacterium]
MQNIPAPSVSDIVTDFLGSAPSLEEIATYQLPDELQKQAHDLLQKNRDGMLSNTEQAEMEEFRQIDHLLTLIKVKAKLKLKANS